MIPKLSDQQQNIETSWDFLKALEAFSSHGFQHLALPSGIELLLMNFKPDASVKHTFSIDQSPIIFSFHILGRGRSTISHSLTRKKSVDSEHGKSIISFNPESSCKAEILGQQHYRALSIYISPGRLYAQFNEELDQVPRYLHPVLENSDQTPFNHVVNMTPHTRMILDQIYNCPYQGVFRKLYLEGKSIELIVQQLWEVAQMPVQNYKWRLHPVDIERIHKVKDILISDLENPPMLKELAKRTGLNDTKLKMGFLQVFGTTAYEYFRTYRINKSREILDQGKLNIDETAYLLGFHDATHFIKNFKNYFGTTPGTYLKKILQ